MIIKLAALLGLVCGVDVTCPPPMPPLGEMEIWASVYDPAHCYDENGRVIRNINCDSDPTVMATSLPVADYYGVAAACRPEWIGKTLIVEGIGERPCLDTGPAIVPTFRVVYDPDEGFVERWVIVVDFLEHHDRPPDWQYGLFDEWRIE